MVRNHSIAHGETKNINFIISLEKLICVKNNTLIEVFLWQTLTENIKCDVTRERTNMEVLLEESDKDDLYSEDKSMHTR